MEALARTSLGTLEGRLKALSRTSFGKCTWIHAQCKIGGIVSDPKPDKELKGAR